MDEVVQIFNSNGVRYLLIGGQAVRLQGMPRFSMDWDIYIPPKDEGNIEKINRALGGELDVPLVPIGSSGDNFVQTYQTRWGVIQFHLGGPGLPAFERADARAVVRMTENGVPVRCLNGYDLLASKRCAGRPQDQEDIRFLEKKAEAGTLS
jgi:hypothetical protein